MKNLTQQEIDVVQDTFSYYTYKNEVWMIKINGKFTKVHSHQSTWESYDEAKKSLTKHLVQTLYGKGKELSAWIYSNNNYNNGQNFQFQKDLSRKEIVEFLLHNNIIEIVLIS